MELNARCLLIPDEEFALCIGETDERLAERFGVPAEQIPAKRRDMVRWPSAAERVPEATKEEPNGAAPGTNVGGRQKGEHFW